MQTVPARQCVLLFVNVYLTYVPANKNPQLKIQISFIKFSPLNFSANWILKAPNKGNSFEFQYLILFVAIIAHFNSVLHWKRSGLYVLPVQRKAGEGNEILIIVITEMGIFVIGLGTIWTLVFFIRHTRGGHIDNATTCHH